MFPNFHRISEPTTYFCSQITIKDPTCRTDFSSERFDELFLSGVNILNLVLCAVLVFNCPKKIGRNPKSNRDMIKRNRKERMKRKDRKGK